MCEVCGVVKRSDGFENFKEGNKVCKACEKSSKSIKSQSGKSKLTAKNLKTLPVKSLVGSKRSYSSISSYQTPAQQSLANDQCHQEQASHQNVPQSDIQMTEASAIQTVQYVVVAKTDFQTIKLLKELETSNKSTNACAQQVQTVCEMFTQEVVIGFFNSEEHPKLSQYIIEVLKRFRQLEDNEIIGLLIASFNIGDACWVGAIKLLNVMDDERRQAILQMFQLCLCKQYKEEIANWCCKYWRQIEQQHINLMKYLHINPTTVDSEILMVSLAVVIQDQRDFVSFVFAFISSAPAAQMAIDTIVNRPHQSKMTFDLLDKLIGILQDESFASTIETIKESLFGLQLCKWVEEIEQSKASSNIIDSESIQSFLDELIAAYGEIKALQKDLTQTDDFRFELLLSTASKVPNARQFAQAQYCIGKLYQQQRQLCVVPSGQGKSRIAATVAAIGLMCDMFTKVHIVFDNKHLLDRDHADFEDYWMLLSYGEDQCQYHIDVDFTVEPNELVIIDEADVFMFKDPIKFQQFTSECACICFTATPDNQQAKGLEARVVASLKFEKFYYVLDPNIQKINLDFDKEVDSKTLEDKAAFIKEQSIIGPVLVYCDKFLTEQLVNLECSVLMMEQSVDPEVLRQLDEKVNGSHRVVISQDQFAMRGIDYRSTNATMTLVIAKSFENQREAIQGFNRVGRFGDACCRVRFSDTPLVDKKMEMLYNASLMKFVCEMQKKPIVLKQIVVKVAQTAKAKTIIQPKPTTSYISRSMDKKRVEQLLGQTQLSFGKKSE